MCRQETSKQNRCIHYRNGEVVGDFLLHVCCFQVFAKNTNSKELWVKEKQKQFLVPWPQGLARPHHSLSLPWVTALPRKGCSLAGGFQNVFQQPAWVCSRLEAFEAVPTARSVKCDELPNSGADTAFMGCKKIPRPPSGLTHSLARWPALPSTHLPSPEIVHRKILELKVCLSYWKNFY